MSITYINVVVDEWKFLLELQDVRCPSLLQIPPGQRNDWPNYKVLGGAGVQSMMHMFGSGFYPPFMTTSFNGMSSTYGGFPHGVLTNASVHSQTGHFGGASRNG